MTAASVARAPNRGMRARIGDFWELHRSSSVIVGMVAVTGILYFVPYIPPFSLLQAPAPWYDAFANAGVFVLLAVGLNIVVGLAGLLDLGYAAFYAIGAYTYAYSNSPYSGVDLPFLPMLIVGAFTAAVFGIALGAPTLRLRGDYLAIMTLGFGEIVPIVFLNLEPWTEGTNGIGGIHRPEDLPGLGDFTATTPFAYFGLMVGILTIVMILVYRLQDSRVGRAWIAIREDELAAAANGINTVTTKLLAFALGATTAGLAGVYNASKLTVVSPDQFSFSVSFTVLAMVILGGIGNVWGVALGAFIVYLLQAVFLRQLNTLFEIFPVPVLSDINFTSVTLLLYGIALVLMMLFRPEGLFPSARRRRELHVADELAPDVDEEAEFAEAPIDQGPEADRG